MRRCAWLRRVVPREGESNRSRWDTDPAWHVVQRADFGPVPLAARRLIRQAQRLHDLEKIDQQLLGLLKTREAIVHADPTGRDLSAALRDVLRALERELARRGEGFGEAARARRRDRGLPVGTAGKVLPFRPRREEGDLEAERARVRELEAAIDAANAMERAPGAVVGGASDAATRDGRAVTEGEERAGMGVRSVQGGGDAPGRVRMGAWLRWRSAETRMRQAFAALEAAEAEGRPPAELERLAAAFARASSAHAAAKQIARRLGGMDGLCASGAGRDEERNERHG